MSGEARLVPATAWDGAEAETTALAATGETRLILCGWCHKATADHATCAACGHPDPERPWEQRGTTAPVVRHDPGRPELDPADVARRLAAARTALGGRPATVEALAGVLDVSPRTVRRWQKVAG